MKIIIDRQDIVAALAFITSVSGLNYSTRQPYCIFDAMDILEKILINHPRKTDGVLGLELDEWPDYAPDLRNEPTQILEDIKAVFNKHGYTIE